MVTASKLWVVPVYRLPFYHFSIPSASPSPPVLSPPLPYNLIDDGILYETLHFSESESELISLCKICQQE